DLGTGLRAHREARGQHARPAPVAERESEPGDAEQLHVLEIEPRAAATALATLLVDFELVGPQVPVGILRLARRVGGVGEADPATAEEVEPVGLAATVVERQLVGGRAEAPGAGIEAKLQALAHEDAATAHDPYVADRDELLVVLVP